MNYQDAGIARESVGKGPDRIARWVRTVRALPVVVPLAALTLVYTFPLALEAAGAMPFVTGDPALLTWVMMWNWQSLWQASWSLADANVYFPARGTLFFSDLLLPATLPFGAIYAVSGNPILAGNWTVLLSIFLNAASTAWLAHRWTNDRLAAFVGGAVGAFSPLILAKLIHFQLMMFWWTPLALVFADAYSRRPRFLAGLGVVLCLWLQFLTAVYLSFYTLFACAILLATAAATFRRGPFLGRAVAMRCRAESRVTVGASGKPPADPIDSPSATLSRSESSADLTDSWSARLSRSEASPRGDAAAFGRCFAAAQHDSEPAGPSVTDLADAPGRQPQARTSYRFVAVAYALCRNLLGGRGPGAEAPTTSREGAPVRSWRFSARFPGPTGATRRIVLHGMALAAVAAALFLPPVLGYTRATSAWDAQRPPDEVRDGSAGLASFLNTDPGLVLYGEHPLRRFTTQAAQDYQKRLFPGFATLALALLASRFVGTGQADRQQQIRLRAMLLTILVAAVLAAGPYLILGGGDTGIPLPYLALQSLVPGFQAMRMPARFALMAVPALAVLAAFGILALRQGVLGPRLARIGPWLATGWLLLELLRSPLPMVPFDDAFDGESRELLATARGAIYWLPHVEPDYQYANQNIALEVVRMVQNRALIPMVNGYTGLMPPTYLDLHRLAWLEAPALVATVLKNLDVSTVLLDTRLMSPALVAEWDAAARDEGSSVRFARTAGNGRLRLYEIGRVPSPAPVVNAAIANEQFEVSRPATLFLDLTNAEPAPWVNRHVDGLQSVGVRWVYQSDGRTYSANVRAALPLYVAPGGAATARLSVTAPPVAGEYDLAVDVQGALQARRRVAVTTDRPPTSRERGGEITAELRIEPALAPELTLRPGAPLRLRGSVANTAAVIWPIFNPLEPIGHVRVGYRWYPRGRENPESELRGLQGRFDLSRAVWPGQSAPIAGTILAPGEPGQYTLEIGLVVEGIAWLQEARPPRSAGVWTAIVVQRGE
ncbi:MAG: hypothetical protein HY331_02840 [Chloroflexi bacterium]|nr:hypothetical protein [Chloroflexota bacterium]